MSVDRRSTSRRTCSRCRATTSGCASVDNGVGISPEARAHLFEPFFTTKDIGKGTGLGLASVYGIVRQSNGFIAVESQPGGGTTFTIHFPAVASEPTTQVPTVAAGGTSHGRETILLVEDEDAVRVVVSAVLRRQGYNVLEASSPRGAWDIFERHAGEIDLLLTDVVMPEMNGPALAQRLVDGAARAARPVHLGLRRHDDAARVRQPERQLPQQTIPGVGPERTRAGRCCRGPAGLQIRALMGAVVCARAAPEPHTAQSAVRRRDRK